MREPGRNSAHAQWHLLKSRCIKIISKQGEGNLGLASTSPSLLEAVQRRRRESRQQELNVGTERALRHPSQGVLGAAGRCG